MPLMTGVFPQCGFKHGGRSVFLACEPGMRSSLLHSRCGHRDFLAALSEFLEGSSLGLPRTMFHLTTDLFPEIEMFLLATNEGHDAWRGQASEEVLDQYVIVACARVHPL